MLIKILKTIFSDVRQAVVPATLLLFFGGSAGLLVFSQKALDFSIQTANTPTPLWATISLVLVCCVYIYLKPDKNRTFNTPKKIKFFDVGGYRWKAIIHRDDYFELDKYPYCPVHDVRFVFSRDRKFCPGNEAETCENNLPQKDEFIEYEAAKSIIESKIRNN